MEHHEVTAQGLEDERNDLGYSSVPSLTIDKNNRKVRYDLKLFRAKYFSVLI